MRQQTPTDTVDFRAAGREQRQRNADSALGSLRIEGLEVDAETRAIVDRYVAGDISIDEVMPLVRRLH